MGGATAMHWIVVGILSIEDSSGLTLVLILVCSLALSFGQTSSFRLRWSKRWCSGAESIHPKGRCLAGRLLSAHIAQWWCCCVNNLVMLCQVIVFSCFLSQMNFVGICPLRLPCSILFTFHNLRFNSISQPNITNSSNLKSPGCSTWSASTWRWVQLITEDNGGDYDNDRWR